MARRRGKRKGRRLIKSPSFFWTKSYARKRQPEVDPKKFVIPEAARRIPRCIKESGAKLKREATFRAAEYSADVYGLDITDHEEFWKASKLRASTVGRIRASQRLKEKYRSVKRKTKDGWVISYQSKKTGQFVSLDSVNRTRAMYAYWTEIEFFAVKYHCTKREAVALRKSDPKRFAEFSRATDNTRLIGNHEKDEAPTKAYLKFLESKGEKLGGVPKKKRPKRKKIKRR